MPVVVSCPSCGKAGRVPDAYRGRRVNCPQCGNGFVIPTADAQAPPTAEPDASRPSGPKGALSRRSPQPEPPAAVPASESNSRLQVRRLGDITVVQIATRSLVDPVTIDEVGRALLAVPEGMGVPQIVVNFTGIGYLSSAMLGKVVAMHGKVKAAGGKLVLCGINPELMEVFTVTALHKLFTIRRDQDEAMQAF